MGGRGGGLGGGVDPGDGGGVGEPGGRGGDGHGGQRRGAQGGDGLCVCVCVRVRVRARARVRVRVRACMRACVRVWVARACVRHVRVACACSLRAPPARASRSVAAPRAQAREKMRNEQLVVYPDSLGASGRKRRAGRREGTDARATVTALPYPSQKALRWLLGSAHQQLRDDERAPTRGAGRRRREGQRRRSTQT